MAEVPPALRLMRFNWDSRVHRDGSGVPRLRPEIVAELGRLTRIIDVRDLIELEGPLGHIPNVTHVPLARVGDVASILDKETCVVVVSGRGDRAGIAARYLSALGMKRVAAMEGGMTSWKQLGFSTLRDHVSIRDKLVAFADNIGRDGKPLDHTPQRALTVADIEAHVGDTTSVRWVKLAAFLLHGKRSCVDGRDDNGVIGTPGGDMGELLLALAAVERITSTVLDDHTVARVLERHLDTFGRFYMHSDTHAMNALIVDGLRKDERIIPHIGDTFEPLEWRAWMSNPPQPARAALLEHLSSADAMGCGHLRLAMKNDAYGVRPALASSLLRAFHMLRWAGAPELEWVILGGHHGESAVANVTVEGELHSYTRIPLVSPLVAGSQMFINHPQVTSFVRREMATFLVEADLVEVDKLATLGGEIEALGAVQARLTLEHLAKGLPVFDIRFGATGAPQVAHSGIV